jgi:hypothetical protein
MQRFVRPNMVVPNGRRPAKLAHTVQENLCGSALAAATRETARLFAFAGAVSRSRTIESLGASITSDNLVRPDGDCGFHHGVP